MGKKFNRNNFKKKQLKFGKSPNNSNIENNFNLYDSDDEDINYEQQQKIMDEITDGYIILNKLNSSIFSERESITSLLASYEFDSLEKNIRDQIITLDMCKSLVEKLTDPYIHIRYNAISAIMNLFFCFADTDFEIERIFFFNTNLIPNLEFLLYENNLIHLEKNKQNFTQSEISKNEKLIKNIWELLILITELYDESREYQKINFDIIIKNCVENLINYAKMQEKEMQNFIDNSNNDNNSNNYEFINLFEEIVIKSNIFLANLSGVKPLKISEGNMLKEFMEFSFRFLSDFKNFRSSNLQAVLQSHVFCIFSFISCAMVNTLFYLYCANLDTPMNLNLGDLLLRLFENIDFSLGSKIIAINEEIQNFVNHFNKEEKTGKTSDNVMLLEENVGFIADNTTIEKNTSTMNKSEESEKLSNMKKHLKILDANIKLNNLNLKTINDIITQFDGYNSINGTQFKNKEELKEMEELERKIYMVLNEKKFLVENSEKLKLLLNENFLSNLCGFLNNLTIEEFLFNDFDKMLVIKEGLFELEYNVFSIINNLILDFSSLFTHRSDLMQFILFSVYKRLQFQEFSKNEDFIEVLLTTFRNILEKIPKLDINISELDYKTFFLTLNKNINDRFIKLNIIDIIALLYSKYDHPLNVNMEICNILYEFFFKEDDMEVIAHVLNAFFDIYRDEDYNINLINKGVIETMKAGVKEFQKRIDEAYKSDNQYMDEEAYEYCILSLENMINFIAYKEDVFKKQV